jgi:hypothetical protein
LTFIFNLTKTDIVVELASVKSIGDGAVVADVIGLRTKLFFQHIFFAGCGGKY